ncbi:Dynein beta chain [Blattella germanica]|nr:Dynein beta chain [Blattella germanica]
MSTLDKEMRTWDTYISLEATVKNMLTSLRAVGELQNSAIRERHWQQLMKSTKVMIQQFVFVFIYCSYYRRNALPSDDRLLSLLTLVKSFQCCMPLQSLAALPPELTVQFVMDETTTLEALLELNLHECEEEVKNIVDKAMEFEQEIHTRTGCSLLRASEELIETLEDNQVIPILHSPFQLSFRYTYLIFKGKFKVSAWQQKLCQADQVITMWFEVQRTWTHLESIFMSSEDIKTQLPEDSERFYRIDMEFKQMMEEMKLTPNVVEATNKEGLSQKLEVLQKELTLCEKALAEYLETKRLAFPRFYFVSSADLLDILSNGNQPKVVARHLTKLFDSLAHLKFNTESDGSLGKKAVGMIAKDGEYVEFSHPSDCSGPVEVWLNRLQDSMRSSLRHYFSDAVVAYEEKPREQWLFDYPAQVSLCGTQIWWTTEVNIAFSRLEEGYENAIKDYQKKQISQLSTLITLLIGELSKQDRQKIMTICTIDVHSRDVVYKFIQTKIESASAFQWQSQLRHRWDEKEKDCFANICDAQFRYSYEYLGNTPRLVITPLTDRCYITLTQSCGNIYKGLAQTGAWGCFDEFNRITVEVLSVVAVQVKSVQDAIRDKKTTFNFMGEMIGLVPTINVQVNHLIYLSLNIVTCFLYDIGALIVYVIDVNDTTNCYRPCAMCVPDFELICEIMLVAEGFQEARVLARKFITLYTLCKELLSKQDHYDWGLRAIKSVLVVAGSLKRGDPGRPEEQVLMRALRDFNIPKVVTDDVPVFMGLIGDLFPALDVPRKRDQDFERTVKQAAADLMLQPEDNFILKVVQLEELLEVRHSVFVVGNAGTGKTQVWKTLFRTYQNMKRKPVYNDLNPKAVTNDELFGIINPNTREWKDGLFSVIMRDQANLGGDNPKWILLDGDIDPMWIESLNTVMDDNKILTLASNERIALTPVMRLLFEISNLRTATPATVSRAGILYINPQDLGWNPYVTCWIESREIPSEKSNLVMLFDKYIPSCLENMRVRFKKITPIPEIAHIQMLCHLLHCLLTPVNTPPDCSKEWYEIYFVFACVWAFGAAMFQDQKILEKPLEKKAGRNYGPPGNKTLIYFIDDMNMPEVDTYGTVQPHTLIRQHLDYGHWYDRNKLTLKDIHKCQYVACMNPTAGSFTINPRLQRHFCVFAVSFPGSEGVNTIYHSILSQHMANPEHRFPMSVCKLTPNIVAASLALHNKVSQVFLPTAIKFHYIFNLRDFSNVFQGLLFSGNDCLPQPTDLVRLWMHESQRVYGDKLVDEKDIEAYNKIQIDIVKKNFEELDESLLSEKPNIYCHFAQGIGEPKYMKVKSWESLAALLQDALMSYNDLVAAVNLVLFEDAMMHVCRINRILESPRGSALLVGVGGSGKQSLSRLAAFISSLENELSGLYLKAGLKNVGIMFLMTDAQVPNEHFLVLINDMLASGEVPDLFGDDDVENIIAGVRNEASAGLLDTRENCWKFFIDRVRRQLKVVLCFSPVGSTLRVRARKFPAIINCTAINWFHEWPQEALISVSKRFLEELEVLPECYRDPVARFMGFVHTSVNSMSRVYLQNERRYNYTTPKSFLEQISLYSKLLRQKTAELTGKVERLENGLDKLRSTAVQVDDLKAKLAIQEIELKQKNEAADALIEIVRVETEKVSTEKAFADEEECKVGLIAEEVSKKQRDCEEDLIKAEPALIAAQEALNTLNKANLTELKSFGSPPGAVTNVTAAVMVLLAPNGKIPKDRSWKAAKIVMAKVDAFLDALITYDKENIHPEVIKAIQPYLKDSEFDPDFVRTKSGAAAGLCAWVINIIKFYEVYCDVEPKRKALAAANAELAAAQEKLSIIKKKVASLEEQLAKLTADFEQATAEKLRCQQEADATNATIQLANRLVGGLASENVRWAESVANFKQQGNMLPGDVLLVTAFISYVGCFTKQFRLDLLNKMWLPNLEKLEPPTPITPCLDPLSLLTDDAQIAVWNNEGLPSDRMSTENATILSNSDRWPLMIDPQLQGVKWIKQKYGEALRVIRLGQRGYLDVIEQSITRGATVLLENIEENVDPVLDPLLGRNLIKKGKAIKIGDKEVEYNPSFQLILQTKLANPHYKPEMQAQTTLINFTVTRDGLEDQLLAEVVKAERPDLEELKGELTKQQNDFKIMLKTLEDDLLSRLSSAGENILGDTALVENLETTKRTAAEIEQKVAEAKITSAKIDQAREIYRPAAARASLLYFILNDLNTINPIYQFSLKAFSVVFQKAIEKATPAEDVTIRVKNLIDCITYSVFIAKNCSVISMKGTSDISVETFYFHFTIEILLMNEEILATELDFLLRFPLQPHVISPVDFLSNSSWGGIRSLSAKDEFRAFIEEKLGAKYVEGRTLEFSKSFEETSPSTPIFFILSPGVNPLKDVEELGRKLGFTMDDGNFHNVSLGQGQETVAEQAMDQAALSGHWVILQNIHLVKKWLPSLEKKLEHYSQGSHSDYRVFMSAEPAATPSAHIIPQAMLYNNLQWTEKSSIKITNEPPTGMQANLHKALDNFNQETLEMCSKEAEFKAILFSLCYFHAVVAERRKFGPQGWNKIYPFNVGDLNISVSVLYNYLEANSKIPWEDLRYLFEFVLPLTMHWCFQVDGELLLAPGFPAPPNTDYIGYHAYIDEVMPPESPYLYGLHPNAEIGFLTTTSENLFRTVFEMQPRDAGSSGGATVTPEEKVCFIDSNLLRHL